MKQKVQQLFELAEKRNSLQAAWNRQILNLAAGGLALLVGLNPGADASDIARCFLVAAWIFLGSGILLGAAATYAEVSLARRLTESFQEKLKKEMNGEEEMSGETPIVVSPKKIFLHCRTGMVFSLLLAVVSLVVFASMSTLGA